MHSKLFSKQLRFIALFTALAFTSTSTIAYSDVPYIVSTVKDEISHLRAVPLVNGSLGNGRTIEDVLRRTKPAAINTKQEVIHHQSELRDSEETLWFPGEVKEAAESFLQAVERRKTQVTSRKRFWIYIGVMTAGIALLSIASILKSKLNQYQTELHENPVGQLIAPSPLNQAAPGLLVAALAPNVRGRSNTELAESIRKNPDKLIDLAKLLSRIRKGNQKANEVLQRLLKEGPMQTQVRRMQEKFPPSWRPKSKLQENARADQPNRGRRSELRNGESRLLTPYQQLLANEDTWQNGHHDRPEIIELINRFIVVLLPDDSDEYLEVATAPPTYGTRPFFDFARQTAQRILHILKTPADENHEAFKAIVAATVRKKEVDQRIQELIKVIDQHLHQIGRMERVLPATSAAKQTVRSELRRAVLWALIGAGFVTIPALLGYLTVSSIFPGHSGASILTASLGGFVGVYLLAEYVVLYDTVVKYRLNEFQYRSELRSIASYKEKNSQARHLIIAAKAAAEKGDQTSALQLLVEADKIVASMTEFGSDFARQMTTYEINDVRGKILSSSSKPVHPELRTVHDDAFTQITNVIPPSLAVASVGQITPQHSKIIHAALVKSGILDDNDHLTDQFDVDAYRNIGRADAVRALSRLGIPDQYGWFASEIIKVLVNAAFEATTADETVDAIRIELRNANLGTLSSILEEQAKVRAELDARDGVQWADHASLGELIFLASAAAIVALPLWIARLVGSLNRSLTTTNSRSELRQAVTRVELRSNDETNPFNSLHTAILSASGLEFWKDRITFTPTQEKAVIVIDPIPSGETSQVQEALRSIVSSWLRQHTFYRLSPESKVEDSKTGRSGDQRITLIVENLSVLDAESQAVTPTDLRPELRAELILWTGLLVGTALVGVTRFLSTRRYYGSEDSNDRSELREAYSFSQIAEVVDELLRDIHEEVHEAKTTKMVKIYFEREPIEGATISDELEFRPIGVEIAAKIKRRLGDVTTMRFSVNRKGDAIVIQSDEGDEGTGVPAVLSRDPQSLSQRAKTSHSELRGLMSGEGGAWTESETVIHILQSLIATTRLRDWIAGTKDIENDPRIKPIIETAKWLADPNQSIWQLSGTDQSKLVRREALLLVQELWRHPNPYHVIEGTSFRRSQVVDNQTKTVPDLPKKMNLTTISDRGLSVFLQAVHMRVVREEAVRQLTGLIQQDKLIARFGSEAILELNAPPAVKDLNANASMAALEQIRILRRSGSLAVDQKHVLNKALAQSAKQTREQPYQRMFAVTRQALTQIFDLKSHSELRQKREQVSGDREQEKQLISDASTSLSISPEHSRRADPRSLTPAELNPTQLANILTTEELRQIADFLRLNLADKHMNWHTLYGLTPESLRDKFTLEQFTEWLSGFTPQQTNAAYLKRSVGERIGNRMLVTLRFLNTLALEGLQAAREEFPKEELFIGRTILLIGYTGISDSKVAEAANEYLRLGFIPHQIESRIPEFKRGEITREKFFDGHQRELMFQDALRRAGFTISLERPDQIELKRAALFLKQVALSMKASLETKRLPLLQAAQNAQRALNAIRFERRDGDFHNGDDIEARRLEAQQALGALNEFEGQNGLPITELSALDTSVRAGVQSELRASKSGVDEIETDTPGLYEVHIAGMPDAEVLKYTIKELLPPPAREYWHDHVALYEIPVPFETDTKAYVSLYPSIAHPSIAQFKLAYGVWQARQEVVEAEGMTEEWAFIDAFRKAFHGSWALGGTRIKNYPTPVDALIDNERLGEGMGHKSAGSGVEWAGGKVVIQAGFDPKDPANKERKQRIQQYVARALNQLQIILTAVDMNTSDQDVAAMAAVAPWTMVGTGDELIDHGGRIPAAYTARGVMAGIRGGVRQKFGTGGLQNITIASQGAGSVGGELLEKWMRSDDLGERAKKVYLADVNQALLEQLRKKYAPEIAAGRLVILNHPDDVYDVKEAEVFSPNAVGAILNEKTIPRLKAAGFQLIAGAANNQLAREADGDRLHQENILYVPDYILNAGGLIAAGWDLLKDDTKGLTLDEKIAQIGDTVHEILEMSVKENIPTSAAADRVTNQRIREWHEKYVSGDTPFAKAEAALLKAKGLSMTPEDVQSLVEEVGVRPAQQEIQRRLQLLVRWKQFVSTLPKNHPKKKSYQAFLNGIEKTIQIYGKGLRLAKSNLDVEQIPNAKDKLIEEAVAALPSFYQQALRIASRRSVSNGHLENIPSELQNIKTTEVAAGATSPISQADSETIVIDRIFLGLMAKHNRLRLLSLEIIRLFSSPASQPSSDFKEWIQKWLSIRTTSTVDTNQLIRQSRDGAAKRRDRISIVERQNFEELVGTINAVQGTLKSIRENHSRVPHTAAELVQLELLDRAVTELDQFIVIHDLLDLSVNSPTSRSELRAVVKDESILTWQSKHGKSLEQILNKFVKEYDFRGFDGADDQNFPQEVDETLLRWIGRALGTVEFYSRRHDQKVGLKTGDTFVIAGDNGPSTQSFKAALIAGLRDTGVNVIDLGVAVSGELYKSIGNLGAQGGLYVTRSHVEVGTNGAKPNIGGITLYGEMLQAVKAQILSAEYEKADQEGSLDDSQTTRDRARQMYLDSLRAKYGNLAQTLKVSHMKVAFNLNAGSAAEYVEFFRELFGPDITLLKSQGDPWARQGLADPSRKDAKALSHPDANIVDYSRNHPDLLILNFDLDVDRVSLLQAGELYLGDDMSYPIIEYKLTLDPYGDFSKIFYRDARMNAGMGQAIAHFGGLSGVHPKGHSKVKATMDLIMRGLAEKEGVKSVQDFQAKYPGFNLVQFEYSLHLFINSFDDALDFAFYWLQVFAAIKKKHLQNWSYAEYLTHLKTDEGIIPYFQLKEQRMPMSDDAKTLVMDTMRDRMINYFTGRGDFTYFENWENYNAGLGQAIPTTYTLVNEEGVYHLITPVGEIFWGQSNTSPKVAFGTQSQDEKTNRLLAGLTAALLIHVRRTLVPDEPQINPLETKSLYEMWLPWEDRQESVDKWQSERLKRNILLHFPTVESVFAELDRLSIPNGAVKLRINFINRGAFRGASDQAVSDQLISHLQDVLPRIKRSGESNFRFLQGSFFGDFHLVAAPVNAASGIFKVVLEEDGDQPDSGEIVLEGEAILAQESPKAELRTQIETQPETSVTRPKARPSIATLNFVKAKLALIKVLLEEAQTKQALPANRSLKPVIRHLDQAIHLIIRAVGKDSDELITVKDLHTLSRVLQEIRLQLPHLTGIESVRTPIQRASKSVEQIIQFVQSLEVKTETVDQVDLILSQGLAALDSIERQFEMPKGRSLRELRSHFDAAQILVNFINAGDDRLERFNKLFGEIGQIILHTKIAHGIRVIEPGLQDLDHIASRLEALASQLVLKPKQPETLYEPLLQQNAQTEKSAPRERSELRLDFETLDVKSAYAPRTLRNILQSAEAVKHAVAALDLKSKTQIILAALSVAAGSQSPDAANVISGQNVNGSSAAESALTENVTSREALVFLPEFNRELGATLLPVAQAIADEHPLVALVGNEAEAIQVQALMADMPPAKRVRVARSIADLNHILRSELRASSAQVIALPADRLYGRYVLEKLTMDATLRVVDGVERFLSVIGLARELVNDLKNRVQVAIAA